MRGLVNPPQYHTLSRVGASRAASRGRAWVPALAVALGAATSVAAPPAAAEQDTAQPFELEQFYGLGIGEFDLDDDTDMIGWRLNRSWYFGREDRQDTVSLVWQGKQDRVSISVEEIRFTRRF